MIDRSALLGALDTIVAARRDAQAELDVARAAHLASAEPATNTLAPASAARVMVSSVIPPST